MDDIGGWNSFDGPFDRGNGDGGHSLDSVGNRIDDVVYICVDVCVRAGVVSLVGHIGHAGLQF